MQWIKITDKMPEITRINESAKFRCSEDVLCLNKQDFCFVARWSEQEGDMKHFWNPIGRNNIPFSFTDVTHWCYIPKHPEKKDKKKKDKIKKAKITVEQAGDILQKLFGIY